MIKLMLIFKILIGRYHFIIIVRRTIQWWLSNIVCVLLNTVFTKCNVYFWSYGLYTYI